MATNTKSIKIAEQFGNLIAQADYTTAQSLLTQEAQKEHSPDDLKESVQKMTAYEPGPIQEVKVISEGILEDWPAKQEKDLAWVYVSLMGERFCEAVTVILAEEDDHIRIRYLEWGRP